MHIHDGVHQVPEVVHVIARGGRHGQGAGTSADDQSGGHGFQRSGQVQSVGEGITAHGERQGQQHLGAVAVERAQQAGRPGNPVPGPDAMPPPDWIRRCQVKEPIGRLLSLVEGSQQRQKEHRAYAVVEERFAGQLRFQLCGRADAAEHLQHRDGVGGRDQGAEKKAGDKGRGESGDAQDGLR